MSADNDNDKLADIGRKLDAIRGAEKAESEENTQQAKDAQNMATGVRAGMELVSAIGAGGLIGWGLDKWLDTKPLFLIAMLILGIMTGFFNVYRISQNMGSQVGYRELHQRKKNATNPANKKESD